MNTITIQGARVHNLKNIDVTLPKNKLIVATGISGSGKSSLVFDIIFEEGRKQYLQSLGILAGFDDEDRFERISGLGPTIAVRQNNIRQSNSRSTVGSRTNLLALLALLYAGEGQILCAACGTAVGPDLACPACGQVAERLPATYFSHNSPNGMCLKCSGRGARYAVQVEQLAPGGRATLAQVLRGLGLTPGYLRLFERNYAEYLATPFGALPETVSAEILYGHYVTHNSENRSACLARIFQARLARGEDLGGLYGRVTCPDCQGFRVGPEARRVVLNRRHIGELGQMTLAELHAFLEDLHARGELLPFGKNLLREILAKTGRLIQSRLGHLSLYRETPSLSGGEIQRLFLNAHLDSRLDSLIYVLDEPTAGLHEIEKAELLKSVQALKDLGNTVIVVEHDPATIRMAEHILDIGPKAGVEGGRVVYQGDLAGLLACPDSLTGQYLSGRASLPTRRSHPDPLAAPRLTVRRARTHNLQNVTVSFPLGCLVGVAGVSGSGKSSLISDTLLPLLKHDLHNGTAANEENAPDDEPEPLPGAQRPTLPEESEDDLLALQPALTAADGLDGFESLCGYAEISQAPIGRNLNSNPASYIGVWDKIRALFAAQPAARERGLSAAHFSFNSRGACALCGGSGSESIWLGGDLKINKLCSACHGQRFNEEALGVTWRGQNIHAVLDLSISAAREFFAGEPKILAPLQVMERIGMGYLKLGQPTPSLSGGEAQRIKLAKEIGRRRKGNILYVLDEPTTGLSLYDTARLLELLDELVANGSSVIVSEHHTAVLAACDWIIELGPGGGAAGGRIIAAGTPAELKAQPQSLTGRYL